MLVGKLSNLCVVYANILNFLAGAVWRRIAQLYREHDTTVYGMNINQYTVTERTC